MARVRSVNGAPDLEDDVTFFRQPAMVVLKARCNLCPKRPLVALLWQWDGLHKGERHLRWEPRAGECPHGEALLPAPATLVDLVADAYTKGLFGPTAPTIRIPLR